MYILFDIGGTKTRLATSHDLKSLSEPHIWNTPKSFEKGVAVFIKKTKELVGSEKIHAIAGGIAGPLDKEKRGVINAPNLPGWNNKDLKSILEYELGALAQVENDSALAGLGELHHGAGKEFKNHGIAAYITISTGVGGCRYVDGSIDRNTFGFEPGHQVIASPPLCQESTLWKDYSHLNPSGYLEKYISGASLEDKLGEKPGNIDDPKIWEQESLVLSYGLNNIIVLWSPDIIILGGSMMNEVGIKIESVRHNTKKIMSIFKSIPEIKKAEFESLGGLYGAMEYVRT